MEQHLIKKLKSALIGEMLTVKQQLFTIAVIILTCIELVQDLKVKEHHLLKRKKKLHFIYSELRQVQIYSFLILFIIMLILFLGDARGSHTVINQSSRPEKQFYDQKSFSRSPAVIQTQQQHIKTTQAPIIQQQPQQYTQQPTTRYAEKTTTQTYNPINYYIQASSTTKRPYEEKTTTQNYKTTPAFNNNNNNKFNNNLQQQTNNYNSSYSITFSLNNKITLI